MGGVVKLSCFGAIIIAMAEWNWVMEIFSFLIFIQIVSLGLHFSMWWKKVCFRDIIWETAFSHRPQIDFKDIRHPIDFRVVCMFATEPWRWHFDKIQRCYVLSFACQVSAKSKETVIHTTEGLLSVYIFTRLCVYFIFLHDPNCSVFFQSRHISRISYFSHFTVWTWG